MNNHDVDSTQLRFLPIGGGAWTVPWTMFADEDRGLFLMGFHESKTERRGTCTLHVERTTEGFVVDVSHCSSRDRWAVPTRLSPQAPSASQRLAAHSPLPVVRLLRGGRCAGAAVPAQLPEDLERMQVRFLAVGGEGWTVPHALQADDAGNLFLRHSLELQPDAGASMTRVRVVRTGEGLVVDATQLPSALAQCLVADEWGAIKPGARRSERQPDDLLVAQFFS